MEWWRKVLVLPVKRALVAVAARVRSRKDGSGILKLHNDVQTCEYQDVQVMWEILQQSEMISSHNSNNTNIFKGEIRWTILGHTRPLDGEPEDRIVQAGSSGCPELGLGHPKLDFPVERQVFLVFLDPNALRAGFFMRKLVFHHPLLVLKLSPPEFEIFLWKAYGWIWIDSPFHLGAANLLFLTLVLGAQKLAQEGPELDSNLIYPVLR
uniref:Uncharacterized protein n=1 Tax=Ananas comosus var. bracteatus TaxID=296719 RepID=A0A6V7P5B6_ANACO|nr:unnamed protein product [Ananas comosus var. bracteatus]